MTVTRFDGASLPAGWTAVEPAAGHVLPDDVAGYLRITTDAGADYDSLSGTITVPQGPRIVLSVAGSFDYAVALAADVNNATDQGLDILAMDEPNDDGIRFAQYTAGTPGRDASWFARKHTPAGDANVSLTDPPNNLYGPRSWMRLSWDDTTDTFTLMSSHTGKPGTWHTHASLVDAFIPTSFQIAMTAFGPDANGREMRVAVFVDMDGRADDATTPIGTVADRSTVLNANLGGTSLPPELTSQVNAGGTVSVGSGMITMTTDTSVIDSYAWILGPTNLPDNVGILMSYRFPQPSVQNSFAAPIIRAADTTDLPASVVLEGKYRPGTGLLSEINGAGSFADIVRFLTAHPVHPGETYDGGNEFNGFSMMIEDVNSGVDASTGDWIWMRLETVDGYFRAKVWLDGAGEPAEWSYEGEDHTQHGNGMAIAWAHNDATAGAVSTFEISALEMYEVVVETADPEAVDLFVMDAGTEQPITFYTMLDGVERPVDVTAVLSP